MPSTLLTPAILNSYSPKKDGSMNLTFATQELSDEQKNEVITHYQKFGWLGFVDSEDVIDLDIPDDKPTDDSKTPSQRLRAVLYVYWKQQGSKGNFSDFYERALEKYIDSIKERLDA